LAPQARAGGALHDVEAGGDQRVAAEGEDHRRGVQRPQPPEGRPRQVEVERREGELQRDDDADEEAGDAPEHRSRRSRLCASAMARASSARADMTNVTKATKPKNATSGMLEVPRADCGLSGWPTMERRPRTSRAECRRQH
jgi:hypothetical protein